MVGVARSVENKTILNQEEQDSIWRHFQNQARDSFDLSYPRLHFLAKLCQSGAKVLNIGVGSGYLEKLLLKRDVEVYSLDPCEENISRLREELQLSDRARHGYSQDIPFKSDYFNKVIMTEVLEHLPDDTLHATLDEISRVLQQSGEFIGTVPYREILRENEVICPHCQKLFHRWGHQQSFDADSLRDLFSEHGYIVEKLYPRSFPDFRRPGLKPFLKAVFRYALGRMGEPTVGPNLYFRVRKN